MFYDAPEVIVVGKFTNLAVVPVKINHSFSVAWKPDFRRILINNDLFWSRLMSWLVLTI